MLQLILLPARAISALINPIRIARLESLETNVMVETVINIDDFSTFQNLVIVQTDINEP